MSDNNFRTTITVDATPEQAFVAINDVRAWWGRDVEGDTRTLGAEFTFYGRTLHRSHIQVVGLVPGERVEWHVLDNSLTFVENQTEWQDTRIVFDIGKGDAGTQIRFEHVGLVPTYECYEVCQSAWTFFIRESLADLITTGVGKPLVKERSTAW